MANTKRKSPVAKLISLAICVVIVLSGALFEHFDMWDKLFVQLELKPSLPVSTQSELLNVHYIDVGQGDCELIAYKDIFILIDGGERDNAQYLSNYLRNLGCDELDCVIATHPHADHIGALPSIIDEFGAKMVIMPELDESNTPTTATYERLLDSLIKAESEVIAALPNQLYEFSDLLLTILAPVGQYTNLNNMSVVCRLDFGESSFLFTGDMEKEVEAELLRLSRQLLPCDVLKLGHHGSDTSNTLDFVSAVSPDYAVISCGSDNKYGHPHAKTIKTLEDLEIAYYRTDRHGTVVFSSDGQKLSVNKER